MIIGAPLSDLNTIEAANICGKHFLSRRLITNEEIYIYIHTPSGVLPLNFHKPNFVFNIFVFKKLKFCIKICFG